MCPKQCEIQLGCWFQCSRSQLHLSTVTTIQSSALPHVTKVLERLVLGLLMLQQPHRALYSLLFTLHTSDFHNNTESWYFRSFLMAPHLLGVLMVDRRRSTERWWIDLWSGLGRITCCLMRKKTKEMVTDFRTKGTTRRPLCILDRDVKLAEECKVPGLTIDNQLKWFGVWLHCVYEHSVDYSLCMKCMSKFLGLAAHLNVGETAKHWLDCL